MKLYAIEAKFFVCDGYTGASFGAGCEPETGRDFFNIVSMAHPCYAGAFYALEKGSENIVVYFGFALFSG